MENDFRKEARKQYLHYFRFWFLAIGILAVLCIVLGVARVIGIDASRTNEEAPAERVYDYAGVLTDREEEDLRQYIAQQEKELGIDIVLVTISQPVEGDEALGQGLQSRDWNRNMQAIADDFWDENRFGYNKAFEGDGILLLSNWYEDQKGEMFSTSGKVERALSSYDIDNILDAVYVYIDTDPYKAYRAYVDRIGDLLERSIASSAPVSWGMALVLPTVIALVYAFIGFNQKKAKNTVAVNAYVAGGKPVLKDKTDAFLRKSVVTRRIEKSSSGGNGRGGLGSHGGGGHHHSSSGASHGGGGRRR